MFNIFKKKRTPNHDFDDTDRTLSADIRAMKGEHKKLLIEKDKLKAQMELEKPREEIAEIRGDYDEDEDVEVEDMMNPDMLMMSMLTKLMSGQAQSVPRSDLTPTSTHQGQSITDEQIRTYLSQMPRIVIKKIKKLKDEDLKPLIKSHLPDIDEDSLDRAIIQIKAL